MEQNNELFQFAKDHDPDYNVLKDDVEERDNPIRVIKDCLSNVVVSEKMQNVQKKTLDQLRSYLAKTYGPMGSYTAIITGTNDKEIQTAYSKDGLKVLKNIYFDSPIELAIKAQIEDLCRYVEHQVGDGTTSTVILSSLIYSAIVDFMKDNVYPPRFILKEFEETIKEIQALIMEHGKNPDEITIDDIYKICMISTNGNEEVTKDIVDIYKEYGFDANIDVSISNDSYTKIKTYDGLTISQGYSDPAYITDVSKGVAEVHNAKVYHFADPVDSPQMISYFEKILIDNVFTPASEGGDMTPTVIIAPMLSRDGNGLLTRLVEILHGYDEKGLQTQKPPVLIITNIGGTDEAIAADISRLCNTRSIRKYINDDVEKHDQENGTAVTMDTIHEFAGFCELVSADEEKTKFINPDDILNNDSKAYASLVAFLRADLETAIKNNEDHLTIGRMKKRLNALEANLVEFLVGGITVSDRDALKDLVEDAVKNVKSAVSNGIGYAANFEGLFATIKTEKKYMDTQTEDAFELTKRDLRISICDLIYAAYFNAARILYSTVLPQDKIDSVIEKSIMDGHPYNVVNLLNGVDDKEDVLCSIRTDIEILNAISKIVTIMATSNQCLLQAPSLNAY